MIPHQSDHRFVTGFGYFPVEMFSGLNSIFLTLSTVAFLTGVLGNVFIALVNCSEWLKHQKTSLADCILTFLAISRVNQLLVFFFESLVLGPYPQLFSTYKLAKPCSLLWRVTNHLTSWLATCLSIYYLLKVAHFSHSLFLWLKWRVKRVILVIFVSSFFFLIIDFLMLETFNDLFWFSQLLDKSNLTLYFDERDAFYIKSLTLLSVTNCVPIVVALTSLLLLFLSLERHTKNLQLSSVGSRDISTEAHKKAMKMVMYFLFLFILHFISVQITNWIFHMFWGCAFTKFIILPVYVFPSCHSFILILGNIKLRRMALKVLLRNILKAS